MQEFFEFLRSYSVEVQLFSVIFFTLLISFLAKKFLKMFLIKARKTSNYWDDACIKALRVPVRIIILVVGFSYAIEIFNSGYEIAVFEAVDPIRNILVIFAILMFILRFIKYVEKSYIKDSDNDPEQITTINAITKLLRLSAIITTILILMQNLGINISGVLAFGGVSGIAVGFAAKDLLSNFFGALMIYLDKPFKIGDWIRSPDKQIEGTVEMIGWRQTRIRTFDKRPIYVPNSLFSTVTVENPSRMTHRRIYENIGVRYSDVKKIKKIIANIKNYIEKSKYTAADQTIIVNFNKFAESSLDIMVYFFVKEKNWVLYQQIKEEMLLDIADIIAKEKAEIAYPTMTIEKAA